MTKSSAPNRILAPDKGLVYFWMSSNCKFFRSYPDLFVDITFFLSSKGIIFSFVSFL